MNKIIVVIYLDCREIDRSELDYHCKSTSLRLKHRDIIHYVIPTFETETRVECINPKVVSESEYESIKQTLDNIKEKLDTTFK